MYVLLLEDNCLEELRSFCENLISSERGTDYVENLRNYNLLIH